jgi:hypothetical protein
VHESRRRVLIASKVEFGTTTAGRCSACDRPFEVTLGTLPLSEARERLIAMFDAHTCDEDSSQAAFRVVREATKD